MFVLAESIHTEDGTGPGLAGIIGAFEIFDYLISHGNKAAMKRKIDIEQMCEHLGIALGSQMDGTDALASHSYRSEVEESLRTQDLDPSAGQAPPLDVLSSQDWATLPDLTVPEHFYLADSTMGSAVFEGGALDAYSYYYNDDLSLTGAVSADWEEFERQISRYQ